jgi:hypothetical protein
MDREQAIQALIEDVISTYDGSLPKERADKLALMINTAAGATLVRVVECTEAPFIGDYGIERV